MNDDENIVFKTQTQQQARSNESAQDDSMFQLYEAAARGVREPENGRLFELKDVVPHSSVELHIDDPAIQKYMMHDGYMSNPARLSEVPPDLFKDAKVLFEVEISGVPYSSLGHEYLSAREWVDEQATELSEGEIGEDNRVLVALQLAMGKVHKFMQDILLRDGDVIDDEQIARTSLKNGQNRLKQLRRREGTLRASGKQLPEELSLEESDLSAAIGYVLMLSRDSREIEKLVHTLKEQYDRSLDAGTDDKDTKRLGNYYEYAHRMSIDPRKAQRQIRQALQDIMGGRFERLRVSSQVDDASESVVRQDQNIRTPEVEFEILPNQQLQFEVLPSDTNLRELAEELVSQTTEKDKARVDTGRLMILDEMRKLFGEDHCYFARGVSTGREYVTQDGDRVSEDFIVLVMQHHNKEGIVTREDALAISPIARRHAAFYMRQDVSEGLSWREVFALTKLDAQDLGVRRLKFTAPEGVDRSEAMLEKLFMLANCEPEEFNHDLVYDAKLGRYTTRERDREFRSRLASAADSLLQQD